MDPYKILGVDYNAADDEIKSAYRRLSRKYHPDANVGNPNQAAYEEKFKEVQQAYNLIMDQRQGKATQSGAGGYGQGGYTGYGFGGFNGWGGYGSAGYGQQTSYESQDDQYMRSAASYIQSGYYREGLNVLEQVRNRTAQWYAYSAMANYSMGNNAIAQEHAKTACSMEPGNMSYASLLSQIQGGEARYQQRSGFYGGNPRTIFLGGNGLRTLCCGLLCAEALCGGGMGFPLICCI